MDLLDQIRAFVATARTGSFTAAAEQLGTSNRLTSKYVAELEARLGVRLFQRTTRKVGLTAAGADLLSRAPLLLDDFDELLAEVSEGSRRLTGVLRVSAPVTFGEIYVAGLLGRFAEVHPDLAFDLRLNDRYVDLAAEGIDLAFRIGSFDLASLKVRRLGAFRSVVVASPDYVARKGRPEVPADLARHACIVDTNRRNARRWVFGGMGSESTVAVTSRFEVNSARAAIELAAQGLGIAYTPRFALGDELEDGRLLPLLEAYSGTAGELGAVYLEGRGLPRKVRALIDFVAQDIRSAGIF
jgi:DNA-binding transcriptional LysR family regulator